MKYKLINKPNNQFSAIEQILYNRGMSIDEIKNYLNLNERVINDYKLLGEENLKIGFKWICEAVRYNCDVVLPIDCDTDGYTAAALFINYLNKLFPKWSSSHLKWVMHEGKQHGLSDCINTILLQKPFLVICIDSSSNDYDYHKYLADKGIKTLVIDHHLAEKISENACIINNQLSNYPNKELSGVGVVWQFCRYIDSLTNTNFANNYLDLVAVGLCADMMDLRSFETRYLITKGFKKENIRNPFIDYMIDKNNFPLSKSDYVSANEDSACTSIGAAFFIVPLINAITRSGTMEEKEIIFKSMLETEAYNLVLSNKRGHLLGEKEEVVIQAIRTATNVKNRQTRAEEEGLAFLEEKIQKENLLEHKILLFLLDNNGAIPAEIRGLVANKCMAKYQRPCCVLTKTNRGTYEGSMRGYTKTGIQSFKAILEKCPEVIYVQGHHNAAGLGIDGTKVHDFLYHVDTLLQDIDNEILYLIDYNFNEKENNNDKIISIADMNDYWGQGIDRAYVNIRFKITNENFKVMKSNTLKFELPNNLSIIKFNGTEEEIEKFTTTGYIELDAICKCNKNVWGGNVFPQLILVDYEIIDSSKYYF